MQAIRTVFLLIISFCLSCSVTANDINDWIIDYSIEQLNMIHQHNEYLDREGICTGQIYHVDMNHMIYGKYTMGASHTTMVDRLTSANSNDTEPRKLYVLFTTYYNQFLATNEDPDAVNSFKNRFKAALLAKANILSRTHDKGSLHPGILFWAASEMNNMILDNPTTPKPVGDTHNQCGIILGQSMPNQTVYNSLNALKQYFYPVSQQAFPVWALNIITNIGTALSGGTISANDVVIAGANRYNYFSSQLAWDSRLTSNANVQRGDNRIWDEAGIMTAQEEQLLVQKLSQAQKKFKIYTSSHNYTDQIRNLNLQNNVSGGALDGLEKSAIQRLYEYTGMQEGEIALAYHFVIGLNTNTLYWDVRIGNTLADERTKAFVKEQFIDPVFGKPAGTDIVTVFYNAFTKTPVNFLSTTDKINEIRNVLLPGGLDDDEEARVLVLLDQTNNQDIPALVKELKANKCALLYEIIGSTQDAIMGIWGENNYGKLMQTLSGLLTRDPASVMNFQSASVEESVNRTIVWHSNRMFSGQYVGKTVYDVTIAADNNDVTYVRKLTTHCYNMEGTLIGAIHEFEPYTLGPLDLVMFFDFSNFSIVSDALPIEQQIKLVPAIFLKYASDKEFNDDVITTIGLIGDGLTIMSGPGLIAKAGFAMRVFIAFEMGAAVANAAITVSDLGNNPEYANVVNYYNAAMGLVGVTSLVQSLPGAISSAQRAMSASWKFTSKRFIQEVIRLEIELTGLSSTNRKAEDILKLKNFIHEEWVRRYPGELIDAKTVGAIKLIPALDIISKAKGNIPAFYQAVIDASYKTEVIGNIIKVYDKNGIYTLAEISQNSIKFKYGGWGGDIVTNWERTTTCIAKFDDQFDVPGSKFIKNEFPEGSFGRGAANNGGINILDVDDIVYQELKNEAKLNLQALGKLATKEEIVKEANEIFWNRYNLPFLEDAFRRGDDIRLLSDPTTLFGATGFYLREIEVINQGWTKADGTIMQALKTKYNYKFNSITKTYEKIN